jgi:hypothetical protein
LAKWFDYDLLVQSALARPDYLFVLIGPDYDGSLPISRLSGQPNIFWLGVKNYADLPCYLRYFDAAIIPFIVNEITRSTSPIKLFEYMAGQKPVVTTALVECQKYPAVLVASDPPDFVNKLDKALALRSDPRYLKLLLDTARENTWDARASQIVKHIETVSPIRLSPAATPAG